MIFCSKYETILKMLLLFLEESSSQAKGTKSTSFLSGLSTFGLGRCGRVGMDECSLDLMLVFFNYIGTGHLFFSGGKRGCFFQQL